MRLLLLLFILIANLAFAQTSNWANAGITSDLGSIRTICVDSINDIMYVAGNTYINGNVDSTRILYYQNGTWDTLPGYFSDIIMTMSIYNNELYVGGSFNKVNSIETGSLVKWTGSLWQKVGEGLWSELGGGAWGSIRKLTIINDTLYTTGVFNLSDNITEINSIAKWDGLSWKNVFDIPVFSIDSSFVVFDIEYYNNEFYVCGNFNADTIEDLVKYNGEQWISAGDEIKSWNSQITNLEIYNGELYISGIINNGGGIFGKVILAKYNGQNWSKVGLGFNGVNTYIRDIKVFNNAMYICGNFDYAGDVPINDFAIWNGNKWCGLGGNFQYETNTLSFYHDTLFVSCADSVDNIEVNGLTRWIGGNYIDTCSLGNLVKEVNTKQNIEISLFPNPASERIIITNIENKNNETYIEIYTITGEKIYTAKYQKERIEIDIRNYSQGIYLIKINSGEKVVVKKLIINE